MTPILERMETRVTENTSLDVELPSLVDDMCMDIINSEGGNGINMQSQVEVGVKRIVREVAEECRLPLETDKAAYKNEQEEEKCGSEVCQEAGSDI